MSGPILQKAGNKMEEEFAQKSLQTSKDPQWMLVTNRSELPGQYAMYVFWPSEYSGQDLVRSKLTYLYVAR